METATAALITATADIERDRPRRFPVRPAGDVSFDLGPTGTAECWWRVRRTLEIPDRRISDPKGAIHVPRRQWAWGSRGGAIVALNQLRHNELGTAAHALREDWADALDC